MTYNRTAPLTQAGVFPTSTYRICRESLTIIAAALGVGTILLLCLALLLPQAMRPARAAPISSPLPAGEAAVAGLFFKAGRDDAVFEAPLLHSDVQIDVAGEVARVTVRQRFHNPADVWLEGIYVFPLPERSAVDRLVMTVGERRVEGKIMEREEARKAYEAAAAAGQRASLLQSERPNVFVTSVANVGPGDTVVVEIQFQDRVVFADGSYSLRFPMVVAPRYTPGPRVPSVKAPQVPSAPTPRLQPIAAGGDEVVTPAPRGRDLFGPVRHPDEGLANPVSLVVDLDPGFQLASLDSLYHPVQIEQAEGQRRIVTLAEGTVPADRDFVLEWKPAIGAQPQAAVFAEELDGDSYLMVTLLPMEADEQAPPPVARELIFVIDTSGSMHGPSLAQAKTALLTALDRLTTQDRFNVIAFESVTYSLFRMSRVADRANLLHAAQFVGGLDADGGTEMRPALELALSHPEADGYLRQIVFLTDGAVGNEQELFRVIAERLGQARLFTIGIGSAPNSHFMRDAAELGRGSFTYIGDIGEVTARMDALLRKLERPALTDLSAVFPASAGASVESFPAPLPDLYAGETVSFAAHLPGVALADLEGALSLNGQRHGQGWQQDVALDSLGSRPGVAAVWARAKLAQIEDGLAYGAEPNRVRQEALDLALRYRLVTRYTSLVAIDDEVVRPNEEGLESGEIARNLPQGWSYEHVFGEAAKTMQLKALPAPLMRQAAAQEAAMLPQTATPATLKALIGLGLLCLAAFLLLVALRLRGAVGPRAA